MVFDLGVGKASFSAATRWSITAFGVPFGANRAVQARVSNSGRPASGADGTFGMALLRDFEATTIGFTVPPWIRGVAVTTWSNTIRP